MNNHVNQFYWLNQIQKMDRQVVGDRALCLNQLAREHHDVLNGLVIPASAFRNFLGEIHWPAAPLADLSSSSLHANVSDPYQLQTLAHQIRKNIQSADLESELINEIVTVTQAWQTPFALLHPSLVLPNELTIDLHFDGLLESQICRLEVADLARALKKLWASLFRARSLVYWQHHGVELQRLQLATIVQPLTIPWASGCLSVDERNHLTIRAFRGLGTPALIQEVSGVDNYQLDGETGAILTSQIGKKLIAYQFAHELAGQVTVATAEHPAPSTHLLETFQAIGHDRHPALQAVWLPDTERQQPVLTTEQLRSLYHLAQNAKASLGETFRLEWTIVAPPSEPPQVSITQAFPQIAVPQPSPTPHPSASSTTVLVRGLAASGGQITAYAYIVSGLEQKPEVLAPNTILITPLVQPDWLPLLRQAVGVVTEQGGLTSHAAIIARELGIPAIVGAPHATRLLHMGQLLLLDGDRGEIFPGDAATNEDLATHFSNMHLASTHLPKHSAQAEVLLQPISAVLHSQAKITTKLLVNLSQTSSLSIAKSLPVEGIGLLRSELMMLEALNAQHPVEWLRKHSAQAFVEKIANQIQQFAQAFAPKPVFYRSLDLRAHEFSHHSLDPAFPRELNPILGERGTLSYVLNPALFDLELAALGQVHQQGYTNVHLLLPFVRTVEEFVFCRQRVERTSLGQSAHLQLWIMAEVPSILFLLPEYVQAGVQGISIGTNDLTQLLLAIDRDRADLANQFTPKHPVVLRAIAQLIQQAKQLGIPCSICGQAPAQYPDLVESLIRWGITSISVEAHAVPQTYEAIVQAEQQLVMGIIG